MPLFVKSIKAKRLNIEAMRQELLRGAEEFAPGVLKDFEATVDTWANKPDFHVVTELMPDGVVTEVSLTNLTDGNNKIYALVNDGAPRHVIRARTARRLRFRTGYISKTLPRMLTSRAGGRTGPWRSPSAVDHPGFEGRDFEGEIARVHQPRYNRIMEKAMKRAATASGHA
jgi:hypothetical protein